MAVVATMEISREVVESALSLYLKQNVLGDMEAVIRKDETIDDIFERSPDLAAGKNLLGLELAGFLARTYGLSRDEVVAYDPKGITFSGTVYLNYERVSGGTG